MAELNVNEMLANTFEPKRRNRWVLECDGVDAFTLKTFARPEIQENEVEIHWLNTRRYLAGKAEPQVIQMTLYDPIEPSASQKIYDLIRTVFDPVTGRSGFAAAYKQDMVLKSLDPQGGIVEMWTLKGAWFKSAQFGDLDMEMADPVMIQCEIRFDRAILEF